MSNGPKLRSQPPVRSPSTDALSRLEKLKDWTELPARDQAAAIDEAGEGGAVESSSATPATPTSSSSRASKASQKPAGMPWDDADPESLKQFNVKIPMPLYLRLKWLGDTTYGTNLSKIAIEALEERAARMLKERGVK